MIGDFHCEQDIGWEMEQHDNGKWARTKPVSLNTWTVYKWVGSPAYQTPVFHAKNEQEARDYVAQQTA